MKNLKREILASVGEITCSKCGDTKSALEFPLRPDGKRISKCNACRYEDNPNFSEEAKFSRNPRPTVAESNNPRTIINHALRQSYSSLRKVAKITEDHAAVTKTLESQASDLLTGAKPGFNPLIKEKLTLGRLCLLFSDPADQLTVALAAQLVMIYANLDEKELGGMFYKPASVFYGAFIKVPSSLGKMPLRKWGEAASETAYLFTEDDLTASHDCVSALLAYSQVLAFWLRFPAELNGVLRQHYDWLNASRLSKAAQSVYSELRGKVLNKELEQSLLVEAIQASRTRPLELDFLQE